MQRPGIEPGTFRSSVQRSPNWAITACWYSHLFSWNIASNRFSIFVKSYPGPTKIWKLGSSLHLQCCDPGSNQGSLDLQSNALSTELSWLVDVYFCSRGILSRFVSLRRISFWTNRMLKKGSSLYLYCCDPGSNQGPLDLQSNALPSELSRLPDVNFCSRGIFSRIISLSLWNPILNQQNSEKLVLTFTSNAATRDRTTDLYIFSLTLSQLSYHGLSMFTFVLVEYFLESFL